MAHDVAEPYAGVELGGTKCICTLGRGPDDIRRQEVIPTTDPATTLPAIRNVLQQWYDAHGFMALGVASFGPITVDPASDRFGRMGASNKRGWKDADIVAPLRDAFPVAVALDTDVNGAALAEMRWGSGTGLTSFAYVTIGTGVGVGLIANGRPATGFMHSESGHIRVPRLPGDSFAGACAFHRDCVEGLASGSAIAERIGGRAPADVSQDDPVWEPVVDALAAMIHALVCTAAPQKVALGGGVMSGQPHLFGRIERALRDSLNGYIDLPPGEPYVIPPGLGAKAGPLGAIALAIGTRQT